MTDRHSAVSWAYTEYRVFRDKGWMHNAISETCGDFAFELLVYLPESLPQLELRSSMFEHRS